MSDKEKQRPKTPRFTGEDPTTHVRGSVPNLNIPPEMPKPVSIPKPKK